MNFNSLAELASFFRRAAHSMGPAIVHELEAQGAAIEGDVKSVFGTYQDGWRSLADATQAERVRLGYTPDDPLFRSGQLRDAVTYKVEGESVFVGIEEGVKLTSDGRDVDAAMVMAVHEFGSEDGRVPARPVFGTVLAHFDRFEEAFMRGVIARTGI